MMQSLKNSFSKKTISFLLTAFFAVMFVGCETSLRKEFEDPPDHFRPMPLWHLNGELTTEGIRQQMKDARKAGFSGVCPIPLAGRGENRPGTIPKYLSEDYFARYRDLIDIAEELDMKIIIYDDNDYPSGMAGGKMEELYPDHTMKRLDKIEYEVDGPQLFESRVQCVKLMSAVAINNTTEEQVEISDHAKDGVIRWQVPPGKWTIMLFPLVKDSFHRKYLCVDFMDTVAVRHMINETYEKYKERFGNYFGTRINTIFFDDVGFWKHPRSWTVRFNEKFEEINGFDPRPYYPALWQDIGPNTEAIRNAFFKTRAELLAEGFPKLVGQWNEANGLNSTGHPPGNYDPSPIDMNGDIFKFYRYTQIPLVDVILGYQFGQNGHKLISSAADYYDRPIVATEIYGAFRERDQHFDTLMLYRPLFEIFTRGVNFVIPHGMWYNPEKVYIPPLVSSYNKEIAPALPVYSRFVARSCLLLQGGRRVSELGVIYPFEELAGHFIFDHPEGIRQGYSVSPETDYQKISGILSNDIRCDFTFVHPEFFLEDKYVIEKGSVKLQNEENFQEYKVMFLTGCNTISYKTLSKLKRFYEQGGTIISTTQLPFKASEIGEDQKVVDLVNDIFRVNPKAGHSVKTQVNTNSNGGYAIHIPNPDKENIQKILDERMHADVKFMPNPVLKTDWGKFNYIHKIRDGKHIYMFTNSSDETISTEVLLRGKLDPEVWDPHSGRIINKAKHEPINVDGQYYTKIKMTIPPVKSMFLISEI